MIATSAKRQASESFRDVRSPSPSSRRNGPPVVAATALIQAWLLCGLVRAEFATIIDSPPADTEGLYRIASNTQLNLYPGGVLSPFFEIGPEPGDNIEINLLGGTIGSENNPFATLYTGGYRTATTNVTVNLVAGNFGGNLVGNGGALVTMSGATMSGGLHVTDGSLAVVTGGRIFGGLSADNGSMVQMSGGVVGSDFWSYYPGTGATGGSVFLMSGGLIKSDFAVDDSFASITGGQIDGGLRVSSNGQVDIAGGRFGPVNTFTSSVATLVVGEFRLDGTPIEGLNASAQSVDFPSGSVLTGVLTDGSPVSLANRIGYLHDDFADNRISLR